MTSFDVQGAARRLVQHLGDRPPDALIVLGSGLSGLTDEVEGARELPFDELPGLPAAGVSGHSGRWVAGELEGRRVLVQAGRYHLYEGHGLDIVSAPTRIGAALGARTLLLTNASGGIREGFGPGTLVRVTDCLNLTGVSPGGPPRAGDPRSTFDPELGALAERCAEGLGVQLERGVYGGVTGPSYETPAEVRALARMGADVVGMSTVLEVLTARALDVPCLAISLVTNHAAGISARPLDHSEVIAIARASAGTLGRLLRAVVRELPVA